MVGATRHRALPGDGIFVAPHLKKSRRAPKRPSAARHLGLMTAALVAASLAALMLVPEPLALRPTQITGSIAPDRPGDTALSATKAEDAPIAAWLAIAEPRPRYALWSPDFEGLARRYDAATHPAGGGRDDVLSFGAFEAFPQKTASLQPGASFNAAAPHMRLSVYRTGREAPAPGTFFVDLVRRAGKSGLAVTKSAVATAMPSKFGPVEVADVLLTGRGGERACLAFRLVGADAGPAAQRLALRHGPKAGRPDDARLSRSTGSISRAPGRSRPCQLFRRRRHAPSGLRAAEPWPRAASPHGSTPPKGRRLSSMRGEGDAE